MDLWMPHLVAGGAVICLFRLAFHDDFYVLVQLFFFYIMQLEASSAQPRKKMLHQKNFCGSPGCRYCWIWLRLLFVVNVE
jgi:hypothetical protein